MVAMSGWGGGLYRIYRGVVALGSGVLPDVAPGVA